MTELLKRKQPLPWKDEDQFCNVCFNSLTLKKNKKYGDSHWCSHCKDWRYPKCYDLQTKKRTKIVPDVLIMDTGKMKTKIDLYEIQFMERMKRSVIVYQAEEYDQEFLMSLIPKK